MPSIEKGSQTGHQALLDVLLHYGFSLTVQKLFQVLIILLKDTQVVLLVAF
jgi:hypothetical protein